MLNIEAPLVHCCKRGIEREVKDSIEGRWVRGSGVGIRKEGFGERYLRKGMYIAEENSHFSIPLQLTKCDHKKSSRVPIPSFSS